MDFSGQKLIIRVSWKKIQCRSCGGRAIFGKWSSAGYLKIKWYWIWQLLSIAFVLRMYNHSTI